MWVTTPARRYAYRIPSRLSSGPSRLKRRRVATLLVARNNREMISRDEELESARIVTSIRSKLPGSWSDAPSSPRTSVGVAAFIAAKNSRVIAWISAAGGFCAFLQPLKRAAQRPRVERTIPARIRQGWLFTGGLAAFFSGAFSRSRAFWDTGSSRDSRRGPGGASFADAALCLLT